MKYVLPIISLISFVFAAVIFLLRFLKKSTKITRGHQECANFYKVFLIFIEIGVLFALILFVRGKSQFPDKTFDAAVQQMFCQTDVNSYVAIAQHWYGAENTVECPTKHFMIVFFPLWPVLLRLAHAVVPIGYYALGTIIQIPIFAFGMTLFVKISAKHYGINTAIFASILILASPGSFFFISPMSESLFFALCMIAFYALDCKKPILFSASAYLAALCRSPGVLLFVPCFVVFAYTIKEKSDIKKRFAWAFSSFSPILGTATYLAINKIIYGDAFAFVKIQKSNWSQGIGLFPNTILYHEYYFINGILGDNHKFAIIVSLLTIVIISIQIFSILVGSYSMPISWGLYSLAYIALVDGATWLLSAPRYALCLPFVPLVIASQLKTNFKKAAILAPCIVSCVLYFYEFLCYAPIY